MKFPKGSNSSPAKPKDTVMKKALISLITLLVASFIVAFPFSAAAPKSRKVCYLGARRRY